MQMNFLGLMGWVEGSMGRLGRGLYCMNAFRTLF